MDIDQIIRRWLAGEKIRGIAETRRQHIERVRYARNLKKECAGLVAGQAVLTAEITWHPQAIVAVVQMQLAQ